MVGKRQRLGTAHRVGLRVVLGGAIVAAVMGVGLSGVSSASTKTTVSTEVLTGVSCVKTECYLVGSTDLSGGSAIVAKSTTSGDTWGVQKTPAGIEVLNGVYCVAKTSCKAVGETKTNLPVIVSTPTSGSKWVSETAPVADGELLAVTCGSTTICWAGGYASGFTSGAIAETTDGGATWSPDAVPGGATGVQEVTGFACKGTAPTPIHCYATGNSSHYGQDPYLMKSTSTVKGWTSVKIPTPTGVPGTLEGAYCYSEKTCIFVGNDPADFVLIMKKGKVAKLTSTHLPSGITGLTGISCEGKTDCTAVGSGTNGVALILRSTDKGTMWTAQTAPTGAGALSSLSCTSATHCVAVGQKAAGGPEVLVTTDGGTMWSSVTAPT
jgi:photosystem II stability/assembly factor-like uncharacterized protein